MDPNAAIKADQLLNEQEVFTVRLVLYRAADKSLARPGRKQSTATKL